MLQRTWLVGLVVTALAGCRGPEGVCLQAGCEAAVPVAVVDDGGAGGGLRAGAYRFVVGTDYAEAEWTCTLPGGECGHDYFTDFEDGDASGTYAVQARAGETGLEIEVLETRGNVWSGPERLVVRVERDGALSAEESYAVKYRTPATSDAWAVCLSREGGDLVMHLPE